MLSSGRWHFFPGCMKFCILNHQKGVILTTIDICRKCYSNHTSCCTVKSKTGEKMMIPPVSRPEIDQILNFLTDKKEDQIFEVKQNSPFYIRQMFNLFPGMEDSVLRQFPENGRHFELKTAKEACVLLGSNGCTLPRDIRPHFCQIYPFWFFEYEPHVFQDSDCLALQTSNTVSEVFLSLGTNPEMLKEIHSRICQDWGLFQTRTPVKLKHSL